MCMCVGTRKGPLSVQSLLLGIHTIQVTYSINIILKYKKEIIYLCNLYLLGAIFSFLHIVISRYIYTLTIILKWYYVNAVMLNR